MQKIMKIKEYRTLFIEKLSTLYGGNEAEHFFYMILEDRLNLKRIDLALQPDLFFDLDNLAMYDYFLEQLLAEIPIQYLLGTAHFFGLEFKVNPAVLIPRSETEELVKWIIDTPFTTKSDKPLKILDIGTGSGCIAISLAKNIHHAVVYAIDISTDAISTATENAVQNDVKIHFIQMDVLKCKKPSNLYCFVYLLGVLIKRKSHKTKGQV